MLCIVPSVTMALAGFGMAELRYASGLFNLMRNLGGAIGIAVVNTWLQDDSRPHAARVFRTMAWVFVAALVLVPFCRPSSNQSAAAPVDAH